MAAEQLRAVSAIPDAMPDSNSVQTRPGAHRDVTGLKHRRRVQIGEGKTLVSYCYAVACPQRPVSEPPPGARRAVDLPGSEPGILERA
jgi:hypothetical protein